MSEITVKVGDLIKINVLVRAVYGGMNNSTTFTITWPNLGNCFYPAKTGTTITMGGKKFTIKKVDAEELTLEEA